MKVIPKYDELYCEQLEQYMQLPLMVLCVMHSCFLAVCDEEGETHDEEREICV